MFYIRGGLFVPFVILLGLSRSRVGFQNVLREVQGRFSLAIGAKVFELPAVKDPCAGSNTVVWTERWRHRKGSGASTDNPSQAPSQTILASVAPTRKRPKQPSKSPAEDSAGKKAVNVPESPAQSTDPYYILLNGTSIEERVLCPHNNPSYLSVLLATLLLVRMEQPVSLGDICFWWISTISSSLSRQSNSVVILDANRKGAPTTNIIQEDSEDVVVQKECYRDALKWLEGVVSDNLPDWLATLCSQRYLLQGKIVEEVDESRASLFYLGPRAEAEFGADATTDFVLALLARRQQEEEEAGPPLRLNESAENVPVQTKQDEGEADDYSPPPPFYSRQDIQAALHLPQQHNKK